VNQYRSIVAHAPHKSEALPAEPLTKPSTSAVAHGQQTIVLAKWLVAARAYGKWLDVRTAAKSAGAQFGVSSVRIDCDDLPSLPALLRHEYERMVAGDLLLLDIRAENTMTRDSLATALFRSGFERPLMWGGRKALVAELQRGCWLGARLPAKALGAGPDRIPEIADDLVPPPERIYAIARRSALAPPDQRPLRLSIVMPVYNERQTFRDVMEALLAKTIPGFEIEICVVESNSSDGTRDDVLRYADHPRVRLLLEDKPSGKGHAVRAGFGLARGDILLIQDADLEYDLDDYEKLLEPLRSYRASFVLGSRHAADETRQIRKFSNQSLVADIMNIGHVFFTWFFNFMFSQRLRDPFTMYKVFRRDCIHNLRFECNRFDFDHELVGKLVRCGYQPLEINVHYQSRSFDEGKKVAFFRDPPTWIKACLKHRFSTLYTWPESR
jgi:hypothetical protein